MGFADDALLTSQSSEWLSVIFALSLKSTVILATTALLKLLLRPASARLRHKLWCAALFSLLVLPLFSGWLQPVKVPILSAELFSAKVAIKQGPRNATEKLPGQDSATLASDLDRHSGQRGDWSLPIADDQPLASDFSWVSAVLLVWLIGVLFVFSRFLVGVITVRRLDARATQLTDTSWLDLTAELSEELGLSRPVRLLRSHKSIMPMTCMGITAIVLLPNDADCWSADRRRVVVLHELTHIKRRDLLTLTLSQVVCALYWFNPLVWWAVKRLRTEQEWACDESVVASGIAATDYAAHLLDIARKFHADSLSAVTTTAMARPSQLQARLCAVLKPVRERYRSGRMIAISVVLSLVFISTAVTRLVTAERTEEADVAKVTN
ncbi:MAG TPA: M56 family metallopeptidase, partial [Pyrinomonadaceae bacterium]|nr:M56 family metallopeptidase [Pyrinomonadaceae bacterium]